MKKLQANLQKAMSYFDLPLVPTINEIVFNRREPAERRDFSFTSWQAFMVGDVVRFAFGSIFRTGRITNSRRKGLTILYHIETVSHTWYRDIPQDNIISKQ